MRSGGKDLVAGKPTEPVAMALAEGWLPKMTITIDRYLCL